MPEQHAKYQYTEDILAPRPDALVMAVQLTVGHVCANRQAGLRLTCCLHVLQALRGVRVGQQGLQVALAALLLLLATQLGQGTPVLSWNTAAAALGATGAVLMQAGLAGLEKKFTYENYDHAK